jgi:hypothetical protein
MTRSSPQATQTRLNPARIAGSSSAPGGVASASRRSGSTWSTEIKIWRADAAAQLEQVEEIRRKYGEIFGT